MRLFAFSDVHLKLNLLKKALQKSRDADLVVCLDDITVFNKGLDAALENLRKLNNHVMITPVNNEPPEELEEKATAKGLIFVHSRKILLGFKGSENLILLSHSPPFNTGLDLTHFGEHIGSVELRKFIEEESPILCLCGHVHERVGLSERIGDSLIVNPGPRGMLLEV